MSQVNHICCRAMDLMLDILLALVIKLQLGDVHCFRT